MRVFSSTALVHGTAYFLVGIALLFTSCDTLKEDEITQKIEFNPINFDILPATPLIIDLRPIIDRSFDKVTLKVHKNPEKGTLSPLDNFLLTYQPDVTFTEGEDQFQISVQADNKFFGTVEINIHVVNTDDLSCHIIALNDTVMMETESSVQVRFMDNDYICGVEKSSLTVSITSPPIFGNTILTGDLLEYVPLNNFVGVDSIVYQVSDPQQNKSTFGKIIISRNTSAESKGWTLLPRITEDQVNTVFFTDENTGFVGGEAIYKTTDGGRHWRIVLPWTSIRYGNIEDIFFIDGSNGFATFSTIEGNTGSGGVMATTNGGETWKQVGAINSTLHSIYFTSTSKGFIGARNGLYRTVDGGANWKKVVSLEYDVYEIRFTDDKNGFAYSGDNILRTTDGGESWSTRRLFNLFSDDLNEVISDDPYEEIYGLSSNGNEILFLFLGSIWKSTDGLSYHSLFEKYYRYYGAISFSGTYRLGLVVGQMPNGSPEAMISKDGGNSWSRSLQGWTLHAGLSDVAVPSDRVAYAISRDGFIVKYEEQ